MPLVALGSVGVVVRRLRLRGMLLAGDLLVLPAFLFGANGLGMRGGLGMLLRLGRLLRFLSAMLGFALRLGHLLGVMRGSFYGTMVGLRLGLLLV